jgi:hypothetical protein
MRPDHPKRDKLGPENIAKLRKAPRLFIAGFVIIMGMITVLWQVWYLKLFLLRITIYT